MGDVSPPEASEKKEPSPAQVIIFEMKLCLLRALLTLPNTYENRKLKVWVCRRRRRVTRHGITHDCLNEILASSAQITALAANLQPHAPLIFALQV